MVNKEKKQQNKAQEMERILRRLSPHHDRHAFVEKEHTLLCAGQIGEERAAREMMFFHSKSFVTLHDVVLPYENRTVQIDQLYLSPFFALILEVKHIKGELFLDRAANQMMRRDENGVAMAFMDPLEQVSRHRTGLQKLFKHHSIHLPIYTLVVFTHNDVLFNVPEKDHSVFSSIVRLRSLTSKVGELLNQNPREIITSKETKRIARLISKNTIPYTDGSYAKKYQFNEHDLRTGVFCPACSQKTTRVRRTWICPSCLFHSKTAHLSAMTDIFLLLNTELSNSQLRKLLEINDPDLIKQWMKHPQFEATGERRWRRYRLKK